MRALVAQFCRGEKKAHRPGHLSNLPSPQNRARMHTTTTRHMQRVQRTAFTWQTLYCSLYLHTTPYLSFMLYWPPASNLIPDASQPRAIRKKVALLWGDTHPHLNIGCRPLTDGQGSEVGRFATGALRHVKSKQDRSIHCEPRRRQPDHEAVNLTTARALSWPRGVKDLGFQSNSSDLPSPPNRARMHTTTTRHMQRMQRTAFTWQTI